MIYAEKGLLCQGHGGPGGTEQSASLENIDEYISEPQSCVSEVFCIQWAAGAGLIERCPNQPT